MQSFGTLVAKQMLASRHLAYSLPEASTAKFQFMRKSNTKPNHYGSANVPALNSLPVERPKPERIRMMPFNRNRTPANYYRLLGIQPDAVAKDIKSAYYELAKVYHPDAKSKRDSAAQHKFVEIQEAYEVLSDETTRTEYDIRFSRRSKAESSRPSQREDTFTPEQKAKTHSTTG